MTEHHPNTIYSALIGLLSLLCTSFDWAMLDHIESILKIVVLVLTALSFLFTFRPKLKKRNETEPHVDLE